MATDVNNPAAIFWWLLVPMLVLAVLTWLALPLIDRRRRQRTADRAEAERRRVYLNRGGRY